MKRQVKRVWTLSYSYFSRKPPALRAAFGGVAATIVLAVIVVIVLLETDHSVPENAAVIGALIALGGVFTTQLVNSALAEQHAREEALRAYLEQIGELLRDTELDNKTQKLLIRAQTLAVLKGLRGDPDRKRILILFLSGANQLERDGSKILEMADLSKAHLAHFGKPLGGEVLKNKNLRGSFLTNARLRGTDLTGTDLTATDLSGANLSGARNLTPQQFNEANGDKKTLLPAHLQRPAHWSKGESEEN